MTFVAEYHQRNLTKVVSPVTLVLVNGECRPWMREYSFLNLPT